MRISDWSSDVYSSDLEARGRRQRQDLADRAVELARVAAGEVAARGAVVRHEERVAYEGGIADDVGRAGGGMARRVHHAGFEGADREGLAVLEQLVELAPVRSEARFRVEDLLEHALHDVYAGADGGAAAELCLQIRRGGQVVGVRESGRAHG